MNRTLVSQILAGIVFIGSIVVMFGWFFDIQVLKSILPGWVTMKFITALSFFFSAILIFLLSWRKTNEISDFFILIISFALFLLMTTFFISLFAGISTGIENLFVQEIPGAVRTAVPGVPAIPTMLCFIFIALSGLFFTYNPKKLIITRVFGVLISITGGIAIIGYLINIPLLYYSFTGFTSMAFDTAAFFLLLGVSLTLREGEVKQ